MTYANWTQDSAVDPVDLTRRLVAVDTVNPPGRETDCAEPLAELLLANGFTVQRYRLAEGRTGLIARIGRAPFLAFTGHLDTVPLGTAAWSRDPFGADVVGDRLYGRGSSDMKAGVAAFCAAALAERAAAQAGPGVELVITAGEETGSEGARAMAEAGLLGTAGALVVAEPSSSRLLCGHKGALWLRASALGVTAHGAMPEHGVNAVYKAGHALRRLETLDLGVAPHPALGRATLNVGTVQAGANLNSVPDRAEIGIDLRSLPGMDHARLRTWLAERLGDTVDDWAVLVDLPAVWTDPEAPWVRRALAATRAEHDGPQDPMAGASYFTDAAVLTPAYGGVPTIVLGPGDADQAHQTDESCSVTEIGRSTAIYRRLVRDWCGV